MLRHMFLKSWLYADGYSALSLTALKAGEVQAHCCLLA